MTSAPPAAPPDPLAEAAALIRDVGLSAERARRYRALATTVAEPTFDRALALGSTIRRAGRDPVGSQGVIAAALAELRTLLGDTEAAIAELRQGPRYEEILRTFQAGAVARVAPLAVELFTEVVPGPTSGALAWEVPLGATVGGEHFVQPEECVARIAAVAAEGIQTTTSPPTLGGDETIRPVVLVTEPLGAETPVTLVFEVSRLPGPVCRLEHGGLALYYAERLVAPFSVCCATSVTDEWWSIRPDAYAEWLAAFGPLLQSRGLAFEIAP